MKILEFFQNIDWSQLLYFFLGVIVFILVLGIIVLIHEAGHFIIAKKSGILCHEFSIGMGPLIKSFTGKKDGIKYSIRALPLGGYVQMAGEIYEDDDTNKIPKDKFSGSAHFFCTEPYFFILQSRVTNSSL